MWTFLLPRNTNVPFKCYINSKQMWLEKVKCNIGLGAFVSQKLAPSPVVQIHPYCLLSAPARVTSQSGVRRHFGEVSSWSGRTMVT